MQDSSQQLRAAEPWMRGTHGELDPVVRAVIHALELAREDVERWCAGLGQAEMFSRPGGVAHVAFHLRHTVRSLDRLLTYAEANTVSLQVQGMSDEVRVETLSGVLTTQQRLALQTEMADGTVSETLSEFYGGLVTAMERVVLFCPEQFGEARGIGRKRLPTTVAGLLIHCAEHTSRHVGQAVTTAQIVSAVAVDQF